MPNSPIPGAAKSLIPLINIVTICAVIAGADDFVAIARWGRTKQDWLANFLDLSAGIPSQDRFNAVFAALRPAEFEKCRRGLWDGGLWDGGLWEWPLHGVDSVRGRV